MSHLRASFLERPSGRRVQRQKHGVDDGSREMGKACKKTNMRSRRICILWRNEDRKAALGIDTSGLMHTAAAGAVYTQTP